MTSWPSSARLRATARIRVSLSPSRKPDGSDCGVGVVQLDADRAAVVAHRHRLVEAAVGDPQVVEHAQGSAREEAQLGMVTLALQLGDHHHRQHHLVLGEPLERAGVGQQHAGVEDERARRTADCDLLRGLVLGLRHRKPLATGAALLPRSLCQFTRRTGRGEVSRSAGSHARGSKSPMRGRDLSRTCLPVRRASPPADDSKVRRRVPASWQHARTPWVNGPDRFGQRLDRWERPQER